MYRAATIEAGRVRGRRLHRESQRDLRFQDHEGDRYAAVRKVV